MHIYGIGRTLYLATLMAQTNSSTQLHPHDIDLQVSWSFPAEGMLSLRRVTKPVVKLLYLCLMELCFLKTVF